MTKENGEPDSAAAGEPRKPFRIKKKRPITAEEWNIAMQKAEAREAARHQWVAEIMRKDSERNKKK